MNTQDTAKVLIDLCQLDIDAANAYEIALKQIDDAEIHSKIDQFRMDHLRHIDNLSALILKYDAEPPKRTPDLKGYLIEGYTALRSVTGLEGALKAMETNEMTTNKSYRDALEKHPDLPLEAKTLLTSNFDDEKTHLSFIRQTLKLLEKVSD